MTCANSDPVLQFAEAIYESFYKTENDILNVVNDKKRKIINMENKRHFLCFFRMPFKGI